MVYDRSINDYYIVVLFEAKRNPTKPVLILRNIKTGEEIKTKIKQSNVFKAQPFGLFSILRIHEFAYAFKRKPVNGEWVVTDEQECVLESYELIRND